MLIHQSENSVGDNFYKVTKYKNVGWHYHFHANLELIYVNKDGLNICTPGKTEQMKKGDFCLFLSGQPHAIEPVGEPEFCICIFSESFVKEFAKRVNGKIAAKTVFSCGKDREEYVKNLLLAPEYPDVLSIKSMLYALCSEYIASSELVDAKDEGVQMETEILKYISENYYKDITLKDVSESLGYEYHYFSRKFNKSFKTNFKNFINQYRIRNAREMLLSNKYTISQIAIQSGFQSVRNFNKVFKEINGCVPKEYLKSWHKEDSAKRIYD